MSGPFPGASALGFGCASLGSRISARRGLDALAAAFDSGVNWFDLAPSYGDGRAEDLFSAFARGRRDRLYICTKCGIAPPTVGGFGAMLRPLARAAVAQLPGLRSLAARARPPAQPVTLTAEAIGASLDASLKRLKVDHVDVIALHDPDPAELERDEIARALETAVTSGKARAAGVAGSAEAVTRAVALGLPVRHLQFAGGPGQAGPAEVSKALGPQAGSVLTVTHSVFSRGLAASIADPIRATALGAALRDVGYEGDAAEATRAAALDYALRENSDGVVLLSMFSPAHLAWNLGRASRRDAVPSLERLQAIFRAAEAHG